MVNKEPIDVSERIGVYMDPKHDTKDVKAFIEELTKDYDRHCHEQYDHFSVVLGLVEGKPVLTLMGYRKELEPDDEEK